MRSLIVAMTLGMAVPLLAQAPAPSAEEIAKMRAAMPEKARVQAEQPRKVLVFSRS